MCSPGAFIWGHREMILKWIQVLVDCKRAWGSKGLREREHHLGGTGRKGFSEDRAGTKWQEGTSLVKSLWKSLLGRGKSKFKDHDVQKDLSCWRDSKRLPVWQGSDEQGRQTGPIHVAHWVCDEDLSDFTWRVERHLAREYLNLVLFLTINQEVVWKKLGGKKEIRMRTGTPVRCFCNATGERR